MAEITTFNIDRIINAAVRQRVGEIIADETAKVEERVRQRLAAVADEIALSVFKTYEMEQGRDFLTIRVRKET